MCTQHPRLTQAALREAAQARSAFSPLFFIGLCFLTVPEVLCTASGMSFIPSCLPYHQFHPTALFRLASKAVPTLLYAYGKAIPNIIISPLLNSTWKELSQLGRSISIDVPCRFKPQLLELSDSTLLPKHRVCNEP